MEAIYHVTTSYSLWSRKVTLLKDVNPTSSDTAIVGAISVCSPRFSLLLLCGL
ncbi:hypothetical protein BDQ17DRAFT_1385550, partial [Cyathus striatus]